MVEKIAGRFFGLVIKHACDRQTDGRTDGQNCDSQDRASIAASRGNKLSHRLAVTSCRRGTRHEFHMAKSLRTRPPESHIVRPDEIRTHRDQVCVEHVMDSPSWASRALAPGNTAPLIHSLISALYIVCFFATVRASEKVQL